MNEVLFICRQLFIYLDVLAANYVPKLQLLHYTPKNEIHSLIFPQHDIVTRHFFSKGVLNAVFSFLVKELHTQELFL